MAFTFEQYTALQEAIAGGEQTVRYADRSVTYRSLAEMHQILKMMRDELGLTAQEPASGRSLVSFSKGY